MFENLKAKLIHKFIFNHRVDENPGLKYLDISYFDNLKCKSVSFINKNNHKIAGFIYFKDEVDSNRLLMFVHGMGGGHLSYIKEINFLVQSGFSVATFDAQATFSSEGKKLGSFLQLSSDLIQFNNYLLQLGYRVINFVGHSWGAFTIANSINMLSNIEKAVLLSVPISIENMLSSFIKNKKILEEITDIEKRLNPSLYNRDVIDYLSKINCKTLIIHSNDDNVVDYNDNFLNLKNNVKNDNIYFMDVEFKMHNPTFEVKSVALLNSYLKKLNECKNKKQKIKLRNSTNWSDIYSIDNELMGNIVEFLKSK